jgi:phospholipid/cholesterol/gamma-HCH transport system permease protein
MSSGFSGGTERRVDRAPMPIVPLAGVLFFRRVTQLVESVFAGVGLRTYFLRDTIRALKEPGVYGPLTFAQMRNIGVDSVPLTVMVSAFIGAVSALQTRYQIFPGVQLSAVSFIARQMIILELSPLLTGLVLTGRVGARMTAEIGTMRVTEQIDALETLAYDPMAYLVVPRVIAAIVMLPVLTVIANTVGLTSAYLTSLLAAGVSTTEFRVGLQIAFIPFQVYYGLIKATMFGGAIAFLCSYEGYTASVGAEGVGRSTARAVVITSVAILVLDALTALYLARYLQA